MIEISFSFVPGWEDQYSITSTGQIYSHKTNKWLKTEKRLGMGYPNASLQRNGKAHTKGVHRLVAEAFLPNPDNKPEVNHIDGNRANPVLSNLEWVTEKENRKHSKETLGNNYEGAANPHAKLTELEMRAIVYMHRTGQTSQRDLAKLYGVSKSCVAHHVKGINKCPPT